MPAPTPGDPSQVADLVVDRVVELARAAGDDGRRVGLEYLPDGSRLVFTTSASEALQRYLDDHLPTVKQYVDVVLRQVGDAGPEVAEAFQQALHAVEVEATGGSSFFSAFGERESALTPEDKIFVEALNLGLQWNRSRGLPLEQTRAAGDRLRTFLAEHVDELSGSFNENEFELADRDASAAFAITWRSLATVARDATAALAANDGRAL